MELNSESFGVMKRVEGALIAALLPFRTHVPNGLVLFALVRCARVFLRMSPPKAQKQMLDAVVPYLEGKNSPRESKEESLLWTPS